MEPKTIYQNEQNLKRPFYEVIFSWLNQYFPRRAGNSRLSQKNYNVHGILTFSFVLFFSAALQAQTTYYVNDNSTTGDLYTSAVGNDGNAGTAAAPFATINYAISQASSGDTIYVDAGTYLGNVVVNKSLTILGAGKTLTILDGTSGIGALGTVLLSSGGSNIQIGAIGQGMHIKGIDNGNPAIENAAVYLQGAQTNITIEGNNIEARGDAGLQGEYNAANNGIVINANMFTGQTFLGANPAGDGFGAQFTLANVPRQAVTFGGGSGTTNTMNFTFTNNDITTICGGTSITDNSGNPAASHEQGNTIVTLDLVGTNVISNNNFNGLTNRYASALRVRGTGYTIEENRFTGDYALALATHLPNPITALKNYWDAHSGPFNPTNNPCAKGKYVPDNVTFAPFYIDSALTTQSLVQPGPVHNGTQNTFFCNIQPAIDAANAGDSIFVSGGEYIEQVEIAKNLTLVGQGQGVTIIKGFANMPLSFTTSGTNIPVIYGHGADIYISDLTVDGDGQANTNHRYMGIGFSDAGGVINNVEVKGIRHTPLNGAQGGIGIFADAGAGNPRTLVVTNNTVYDFQKNGMSFSGADMVATVDNNVVTGAGPLGLGLPAQNGIQFYGTNGGSIINNTVSDIDYTPTSYVATAILTYFGSDSIKVNGNTLNNVEVGVFGYDNIISVNGNNMNGGDYGLYGFGAATSAYFGANGNFISNFDYGALMYASGGTLSSMIQENSITSFDSLAIVGLGAADTVQAQCNWYGTVDPVAISAAMQGQVKFQDYLTNGTDNSGATGFQPVPGSCNGSLCPAVLYVNDGATTGDVYTTAIGNDSNPGTAASPFATVQAAIDRACAGAIIYVDAGTYPENVNINKVLSVIGVDTNLTIIQGSGGNVVTMVAGDSATSRTTLGQLRVTGGASGVVPSSHNTIFDVLSTANSSYGINLGNLNDLLITNSCFTHNSVGLKIPSTATVTNLSIDGSEFSYNTNHGWYSDANKTSEPDLDTVSITNTAFNYNGIKGIYTERLSNALLQNVTVQSSGIAANTYASGIDINLKWKDYENIEFDMVTVSGSGIGGSSGSGVTIKGRNDGPTYGGNPASLSNLVFTNNNFASPGIVGADTLTGLAIGNAITNISFNGTNNFTGTGNAFTSYIDPNAMAPFSLGTSSFDGGLAHYVRNFSVVDVDALATLFDGKIGNNMNPAELASTEDRIIHDLDTNILGLVHYFDNCADGSCDGCYTAERFNDPITTGASQAPGVWYTDRYAPDSFYVAGGNTLSHAIFSGDGANYRPASFSSAFYNTQGRKYDLDNTTTMLSIDLFVPTSWATTGRRMAGLWGTAYNSPSDTISGYPIIEFVSDNSDPRFRIYDNGVWLDMGLPCDFQYDQWHTLRIEILPAGEFRFSVGDLRMVSTNFGNASSYFGNVILQGHNTTAGVTYDINWDNFIHGNGPTINYDATGPDPIVIGSGLSNQHMAVGEFCGLSASLKAHKRFLGDVVPVMGDVAGDTYQFGTGVSPTSAANTTPDSGTARWNYLVSVNLGAFTFNDLNVYLDIDFDNSDSACQVGPYVADLSQFMIANSMGASSVYQGSENLGFGFWQLIGDPSILPFDPYAEGTYDLAVRIENKDGVELIHVAIRVEVACEFVEPGDDLEPPVLVCAPDTTIESGQSTDPINTGMASVTGACPQNLTYSDNDTGLTGCNNTGNIYRTWYNADSSETCVQTITIEDNIAPVIGDCPSDTVLFATSPAGASLVFDAPTAQDGGFFEGFENAIAPAEAWNAYTNPVVRTVSGTGGIVSKTGNYHGSIDPADSSQTGAFTRLGGYSSSFGTGFSASQDIYIDLTDTNVVNNTYGFDITVAASNQTGGHRRDFIFHAASKAGGTVLIAGSNNTNFTRRNDLGSLNNYEITTSGWYTFEWVFRDSAGSLAVDLNLKDAGGNPLFTETRYNAADLIATLVGGNRYMWFTFLETADLRIDNTILNREAAVVCSASSGDTFPFGVTTVTCVTTDACGNADSCSFTVTVVDTAGSLNFDGVDDVVSVPHDASLTGFGTAITVEAWVKPENVVGRRGIVGKWNDLGSNDDRSYLLWMDGDEARFYVSSTGANFPNASASSALTVGEWTHLAGTFDGTVIRLYVDGVLAGSQNFSGSIIDNTTDPLLIGANDGGGGSRSHFEGDIDEVRIFDRVLCEAEIQARMKCELLGNESGLRAYYNFNQGIAGGDNTGLDSLIDGGLFGNTGTLENMALNGFASNWTLQADSVDGDCGLYNSSVMAVYGNNATISDGQTLTSTTDSTEFGAIAIGGSNTNTFYIVNSGTDVLNISATTLAGANPGEFSITDLSGAVVAPNDSVALQVSFIPTVAIGAVATVEIASDYCVANTFNFDVSGTGEAAVMVCDTINFVSNASWTTSTVITPSSNSGNWIGVAGVLPDTSTFTDPVILGQPYSYPTIDAVDSSDVIKAPNNITYYRHSFELDSIVDISAALNMTFDDQIEVYLNGTMIAAHYGIGRSNGYAPGFGAEFSPDSTVVNGVAGTKSYDFLTADGLSHVVRPGVNDLIVVLRNFRKSGDRGGLSLAFSLNGCAGMIPEIPDTGLVDSTVNSIVSDTGWAKSTDVTQSNLSGNWSGVNSLPATATYTLPAIVGQPYSFATIDAVDSTEVIKTENNITFFRREFELTDNVDLNTRLRMTVDDALEIYINGYLIARENNSGSANFKAPAHDLRIDNGTVITNGYMGGDLYDVVPAVDMDTVYVTGTNEIVLAVRNKSKSSDKGGFSFRLDLDKGGSPVIVKSSETSSQNTIASSVLNFELYPNPTNGMVYIELLSEIDESASELIVQDLSGRILIRGSFDQFSSDDALTVDLSNYAAGVYFVRVMTGDRSITRRVIKK